MTRLRPATLAAQLGHYLDPASGGVVPPWQPSTTFARDPGYNPLRQGQVYGRDDAPGYRDLERVLCALEGGAEALVFPSGMAAIAALFGTLERGEAVVVQRPIYYGTLAWLGGFCARREIALHTFAGADPDGLARALEGVKPALVWIETPSNPMLDVVDIAKAADLAHAAGALLAVDSTAASPILTRPLALGADLVMHSATKVLNGHSDVLAGVLVTKAADDRWAAIRRERHDGGAILGTFEAWLVLRGLRTLAIRVERASANALAVARFLETHPQVEQVLYPGLPSHPAHEVACRQMEGGFGGLLSFLVKGGVAEALAVAGRLEVIVRATSLGGIETLIEHRHSIEPEGSGVPANLLRLSVGLEDQDDLLADLAQALSTDTAQGA
jgi:cystathionine gamma-synthase